MSDIFHSETLDILGYTAKIEYSYDTDNGAPWNNSDGHGVVRKTPSRHADGYSDKKPGERPLNQAGRNEYQFHYDWAGACKTAKKDGWNTEPYDAPEKVARAVQADFDYLRGYIVGNWFYVDVFVQLLDENDNVLLEGSCCGFESLNDHHITSAHGMAGDLCAEQIKKDIAESESEDRESAERNYWASRDVMTA